MASKQSVEQLSYPWFVFSSLGTLSSSFFHPFCVSMLAKTASCDDRAFLPCIRAAFRMQNVFSFFLVGEFSSGETQSERLQTRVTSRQYINWSWVFFFFFSPLRICFAQTFCYPLKPKLAPVKRKCLKFPNIRRRLAEHDKPVGKYYMWTASSQLLGKSLIFVSDQLSLYLCKCEC